MRMSEKAELTFGKRNPDVLTCIANLSNDEVFTPPDLAKEILDMLAKSWAQDHNGENIWENQDVKFLDPCTKSGVFLREITSRLTKGLEKKIPNRQQRVDHILNNQIYGIAITKLTSLLARRSIYCSKSANGKHSITKMFKTDDGHIWYKHLKHQWNGERCGFCGAPKKIFERADELESHAYAFIHSSNIKETIKTNFGADMQFDVIIGNPPYQITGGGGGFDSPIYHLFIEQAKNLEPQYICMVTPSRWLVGGHGLEKFRKSMFSEMKLRELVDFPISNEVFPGVEIKGGVSYFLWDADYEGQTNVTTVRGGEIVTSTRKLDEFEVFVRDEKAVKILNKVLSYNEKPITDILTNVEPFKWASNFSEYRKLKEQGDIPLYLTQKGKRNIGYVNVEQVEKNNHLVNTWKVLTPKAGSGGGMIPDLVLGKCWIAPSQSVCTGSFMFFHVESKAAAESLKSYYETKFFRFLVSLHKITQDAIRSTYSWVPIQSWDKKWTDLELYEQYDLTPDEIDYIETVVRPMEEI